MILFSFCEMGGGELLAVAAAFDKVLFQSGNLAIKQEVSKLVQNLPDADKQG